MKQYPRDRKILLTRTRNNVLNHIIDLHLLDYKLAEDQNEMVTNIVQMIEKETKGRIEKNKLFSNNV